MMLKEKYSTWVWIIIRTETTKSRLSATTISPKCRNGLGRQAAKAKVPTDRLQGVDASGSNFNMLNHVSHKLSLQLTFYPFGDYLLEFVEMVLKEMSAVFDYV